MKRKILCGLIFLASCLMLPASASAQFTTVTGCVNDPNVMPYSFGTVSAILTPATPGGYRLLGQPYSGQMPLTALDKNGCFTVNMGDNTQITPGGSSWSFTVGDQGIPPPAGNGPQSFVVSISISGASQNISAALSAPATKLTNFLSAATGTIAGGIAAGQTAYGSATNTIAGGTVVLDMAGIAGADLGAKMNNCATQLPAAGGTCKGDNLTGAQTLSTAVTTAKPVTYTFCGQAISQTAAISLASANASIVACPSQSTIITKAASLDQITISSSNNAVSGNALAGAGGSFTGNGIVITGAAINTLITDNNLSGEAGQEVSTASASMQIAYNTISHTAATPAVTSSGAGGQISFNQITSIAGDGIDITGVQQTIINNFVILNISAGSATSNLCGISAKGDMIGNRFAFNQTQINDNHGADLNYGMCDNPSGTHNLNMLFEGNNHFGILSGGAQADGFFVNNSNNLNTNWFVTVRDEGCVHLTFCIKRTDTQNNPTHYENIQPGDATLDAGTGSTNDTWVNTIGYTNFANLPNPAGSGSLMLCNLVGFGVQATVGTNSGLCRATGANVWQANGPGAPAVFSSTSYTNATTTASNITGLAIPVVANTSYAIECNFWYQASVATAGLDITVTGPAAPAQVSIFYQEYSATTPTFAALGSAAFGSKMVGAASVTATTTLPAHLLITLLNGANAGTVQVQGSATGVGTVTLFQSFCYQH